MCDEKKLFSGPSAEQFNVKNTHTLLPPDIRCSSPYMMQKKYRDLPPNDLIGVLCVCMGGGGYAVWVSVHDMGEWLHGWGAMHTFL